MVWSRGHPASTGGAWINMRGALWRVANEQMRHATNEERSGIELVNRYLVDMKVDLKKSRGQRKYVDCTQEGPPRVTEDIVRDPNFEGDQEDEIPELGSSDDEGAPAESPMADGVGASDARPGHIIREGGPPSVGEPESEMANSPIREAPSAPATPIRTDTSQRVYPYPFARVNGLVQ